MLSSSALLLLLLHVGVAVGAFNFTLILTEQGLPIINKGVVAAFVATAQAAQAFPVPANFNSVELSWYSKPELQYELKSRIFDFGTNVTSELFSSNFSIPANGTVPSEATQIGLQLQCKGDGTATMEIEFTLSNETLEETFTIYLAKMCSTFVTTCTACGNCYLNQVMQASWTLWQ